MADEEERARHERMIEAACAAQGLTIDDWEIDEDNSGRVKAILGRWTTIEDDEDQGLFEGDAGELSASVVGGVEYGNEQVAFYLKADEMDTPMRIHRPDEQLEPED